MGIDGTNYLYIRGSKHVLDTIQASGLILNSEKEEIQNVVRHFFDSPYSKAQVIKRTNTLLMVKYDFRNLPIYDYLKELLATYPTCWMKNTFSTETGACGVWIGQYHGGVQQIQETEWMELTEEEMEYVEDFSK